LKKIEQQLNEILRGVDERKFRAAWGETVCGVLRAFACGAAVYASVQEMAREASVTPVDEWESRELRNARQLLGVSEDASADQIRRALKIKLRDGRLHPDHGGDGVLATKLIGARDLLIAVAQSGGAS
jgi:hypothetical protein